MATLRVNLEIEPLLASLKQLGTGLAQKAIYRSLNRTIVGVKVNAARAVRDELTLKIKDIKKDLAIRRAPAHGLEAALDIAIRATGLIKFRARQTARGTTVQVKRRSGRKRLPHAFIARMKSGHVGVMTRAKGIGRLPIDELFSTAPGQYLDDDDVLRPIGDAAQVRFTKELSSQVDRLLK